MTLYPVFKAATLFLRVIELAIFAYCILSWFVSTRNALFRWLHNFISPFVAPFRRIGMWIIQRTHIPIDLSFWIAMLALHILQNLLWQLYNYLRFM